jgi:hypothetical protein
MPMLALMPTTFKIVPSGQSLNGVGLFVGFAWHWFLLSAIKVSLAPTFGHTCQMLREFDVFGHSEALL